MIVHYLNFPARFFLHNGSMSPHPQSAHQVVPIGDLAGLLDGLYRRQIEQLPGEAYLREHSAPAFLEGSVSVFRFYEPWLPRAGRVLDWGCRHAPDACLIRARFGDTLAIEGCDVFADAVYQVFYQYAGLRYQSLSDSVRLPYADGIFDAVIASGVLEHVPMDYESLKELHRLLKPGGRLIVAYLPNARSVEEWNLRRRGGNGDDGGDFHRRLYSRSQLRAMLMHTGFWPLRIAYQTQLDALPPSNRVAVLRPLARTAQLHRLTSCLCAVAEKLTYF
jgi:SAM-dependent methyltransferase